MGNVSIGTNQAQSTSLEYRKYVIYNDSGNLCSHSVNNQPHVYHSYRDPQTGYVRERLCVGGIFARGLLNMGLAPARVFMVIGAEMADILVEKKLDVIGRIGKVAKAALYSIGMFFYSIGMVLFPFSTYCWVKLSELEWNANDCVHLKPNLRASADQNKFALYVMGGQPRGHIDERKGDRLKYKPYELYLYDANECTNEQGVKVPFAVKFVKDSNGPISNKNANYRIELVQRKAGQEIEKALSQLVTIAYESHRENDEITFMSLENESQHIEVNEKDLVLDHVKDQGIVCCFNDKTGIIEFNGKGGPIHLTVGQRRELNELSFLKNEEIGTLQELWQKIRDQITKN